MTKTALILIDIQNDYFSNGAFELHEMEQAAQNAKMLLENFRQAGSPIFHIRHESLAENASFFLPDTDGAQIHASVAPQAGETVILKHRPNSFFETTLLENLKAQNIDSLIVCGAMSQMCVEATTRAAVDFGFTVTVIEDACAARALTFKGETVPAPQVHASFMAALGMSYARILSTEDFLSA